MTKFFFLILLVTACSTAKPHVDVIVGTRTFDSRSDWEQTDQQTALGLQTVFATPNGFGPELAIIVSDDISKDSHYENRPVEFTQSRVTELSAGLRKNVLLGEHFQFYLSGGIAATYLKMTADLAYASNISDTSIAYSPYAQTGVNYLFNEHYTAGIMYRRSFWGQDEEIFISDPSVDSNLFALTLGYSF